MISGPIWITTSGFLVTATETITTSVSVVASGTNVSYNLLSGTLPSGLSISPTGEISGTPSAVRQLTNYKFVIRATASNGIADRSFNIDVIGANSPTWNTSSGYTNMLDYTTSTAYLKLGPEGEGFALNRQWVKYQFQATPTTAPENTKIKFYIPENGGELPPGLFLSQDGILSGFMSDTLIFDGSEADTGGYDEESYDGYAYDHGLVAFDSIGVPKIYQFKVTASDGVTSSDRFFKILVISPDMIRHPDQIQMELEPGFVTTNSNYLPPLQFIHGTDLGIARAENNETFNVSAYNGYPLLGQVEYSITAGESLSEQIPEFLQLDTTQGILYGFIPYQPAYTRNYRLTVNATRIYSTTSTVSSNVFSLAIKGKVESSIQWTSTTDLGVMNTGQLSELFVLATQISSNNTINYSLIDGTLPVGLILQQDGSISGTVGDFAEGTYSFTVRASDIYELSAIEQTFTLSVVSAQNPQHTQIWFKPFLSLDKRSTFREFMNNSFVFPQSFMYRFFDPNFGIQNDIKIVLEFDIEKRNLRDYIPALRENFYRKRLYFGDVKVATAKNNQGTAIYEVVYIDIVDNTGQTASSNSNSVSKVLYTNNTIYYPSSINNMKYQLSHLTLDNNSFISVNNESLPLFMKTVQTNNFTQSGYMCVLPLCYALPGQGQKILSRIKLSGFDFKQFDLDIDRAVIDKTLDNDTAKYLIFPRQRITDVLESDSILYTFDGSALETDQNDPINRD